MSKGSSTKDGYLYHEPAFPVENWKYNRLDNKFRLNMLLRYQDWNSRRVIDLGCNVGYFAIHLARYGAYSVGVDSDIHAITFGNNQIDQYGIENCRLIQPDDNRKYMDDRDVVLALSVLPWIYETEKDPKAVIDKLFETPVAFVEIPYPPDGRAHVPGVHDDTTAYAYLKNWFHYVFAIGKTIDETDGVRRERTMWKCVKEWANPMQIGVIGSQANVQVNEHTITKIARKDKQYEPYREFKFLNKLFRHQIAPVPVECSDGKLVMARIYGKPLLSSDLHPLEMQQQFCGLERLLKQESIRHNDIRPSNLIYGNDGNIHLLDFGWAQEADEYIPQSINPMFRGANDTESFEKILSKYREIIEHD